MRFSCFSFALPTCVYCLNNVAQFLNIVAELKILNTDCQLVGIAHDDCLWYANSPGPEILISYLLRLSCKQNCVLETIRLSLFFPPIMLDNLCSNINFREQGESCSKYRDRILLNFKVSRIMKFPTGSQQLEWFVLNSITNISCTLIY